MQAFLVLIALVATVAVFVGLFYMAFRRGRRLRGLFIFIGSLVALGVVGHLLGEQKASEAGFSSASDMKLANEAGISDPAEFEAKRAQLEADAKAKAELQAAERKAQAEAAAAEEAQKRAAKEAAEADAKARKLAEEEFYAPPAGQVAFVAAIEQARREMKSANNDLAKGGVRRNRAKALCAAQKSPAVKDWSGTLETLTTNSDGMGVVKIKIGDDAYVSTMNNAFSDISANTMIDPDDALFKKLASLKEGDRVRFSGRFLAISNPVDCYWEISLTLAGSISSPDFVFRFSSVDVMP